MFSKTNKAETQLLRNQILYPKDNKLTGVNKPLVLLLHSPYDPRDSATNYESTKRIAEDRGYSVINKKQIIFNLNVEEFVSSRQELIKKSNLTQPGKPVSIWLESHGNIGWLFGPGQPKSEDLTAHPNHQSENKATLQFANYLLEIEAKTDLVIKNIILNCCYSATETVNPFNNQYINSPARLLSILLPNAHTLGFIGLNSSAKVSVFTPNDNTKSDENTFLLKEDLLTKSTMPLLEGSMVFKNGKAIEFSDHKSLFCTKQHMEAFVINSCALNDFAQHGFKICPAKEKVMELRHKNKFKKQDCFADEQIIELEGGRLGLSPTL